MVYRDLEKSNGWNKARVNFNVFEALDATKVHGTQFDPNSIMIYAFPSTWTTNGFFVSRPSDLSELDAQYARQMYPFGDSVPWLLISIVFYG